MLSQRRVTSAVDGEIELGRNIINGMSDLDAVAEHFTCPRVRAWFDNRNAGSNIIVVVEVCGDCLANGTTSDNRNGLHRRD